MCVNPLKGWLNKNGSVFTVTRSDVLALSGDSVNGKVGKIYSKDSISEDCITQYIDIPCRSCPECYNDMRRQWITRAVCESNYHDSMLFLTLTYNDDHIPKSEIIDEDTGELLVHYTLRYRDFQLFMKRLRKQLDHNIRFMVCGEYGSHTFRPHYHAIIFGLSFADFECVPEYYKRNSQGDILYIHKDLSEFWQFGYVVCSVANVATMGYVAGYVSKKVSSASNRRQMLELGIVPPFIRSSQALGRKFYEDNCRDFLDEYDYKSVSTDSEPFKVFLTDNWRMKFRKNREKNMLALSAALQYNVSEEIDMVSFLQPQYE